MRRKIQKTIARQLLLLAVALPFMAISSHAQRSPIFVEAGAFTGSLLKPSGPRTTGFGVAVGRGKNFVGVDVSREFLGSYELGVGTTLDPNSSFTGTFSTAYPSSQNQISGSTAESLNVHAGRDLYSFHGRVTAYGLLGVAYLKARSTEGYVDSTYMNNPLFQKACECDPSSYGPVAFGVLRSAHMVGFSEGAGVRLRLTEAFGLRVEFKARQTPSVSSTVFSPGVVIRNPSGNPIAVNFTNSAATFTVASVQGSGAPLKAETFLGITFGVYYRFFNRHM